jgi:hypothetical protein
MKMKSLAVSLFLIVFSGVNALAVIVDFTDMDRGPSNSLQIGDVTISGGSYFIFDVGSMPATVSGTGLGSATIGAFGTVDRIENITGYMRESLRLSVSGSLNSITITPYFEVVGSKDDIFLPFDISYYLGSNPVGTTYRTIMSSSSIVLNFPFMEAGSVSIGLQSGFGNPEVGLYLAQHPGATVEFGFAITSLDYTPAVPETSTVILFGVGLAGIGLLRRLSPKCTL